MRKLKLISIFSACLIFLSCMGAYRYITMHAHSNGKVELLLAVPQESRVNANAFPAGWCSLTVRDVTGAGDNLAVFSFSKTDVYYEHIHIPHGTKLDWDSLDLDIHYMPATANTGNIKFKVSVWHLYEGQTVASLGAAGATYTVTCAIASPAQYVMEDCYTADALDLTAEASNYTVHSGLLVKLERLDTGDGDTLTGEVDVMHMELWVPTDGTAWYGR